MITCLHVLCTLTSIPANLVEHWPTTINCKVASCFISKNHCSKGHQSTDFRPSCLHVCFHLKHNGTVESINLPVYLLT